MTSDATAQQLIDGLKDVLASSQALADRLSERIHTMQTFIELVGDEPDRQRCELAFVAIMDWNSQLRDIVRGALRTLEPLADPRRGLRLVADHPDDNPSSA